MINVRPQAGKWHDAGSRHRVFRSKPDGFRKKVLDAAEGRYWRRQREDFGAGKKKVSEPAENRLCSVHFYSIISNYKKISRKCLQ